MERLRKEVLASWAIAPEELLSELGGEIGAVAIHAVEALDRNPRPAFSATRAPANDRGLEGVDIVVAHAGSFGAATLRRFADSFAACGLDRYRATNRS